MNKKPKKISDEQFVAETYILPDVLAENVVREAAALVAKMVRQSHVDLSFYDTMSPGTGIFRGQDEPVQHLVSRALASYADDPAFKKKLRQDSGGDHLEAYMHHWLSAEMLSRTKSSLLRAYLTELTEFANGEHFRG
jgi:hypothetical protein